MACITQSIVPNHNDSRNNDRTGAHVAHDQSFKFHSHEIKFDCTNVSHNHDESVDMQQPNVKYCRYRSRHHFILSFLALLFVAINFSPCCCENNCPLITNEKSSISNDAASIINQDPSLMAISTSDDDVMCGITERSSDNDEMVLGDNAPLLAMFGIDWEILASLHYNPEYILKPAGTEMILHPMATYNQKNLMRCKRPGPTLNGRYRCSKLDDTHLNKCAPADNDNQDSNKSSSFCPLRKFNSNYLHLYTRYTMISTMKGLLLSDDIISIIVHQKMLQIQQKYVPFVFWLMVIGLTIGYFRIISGMNYDDNIRRRDIQFSQSGANIQSTHDGEMDSDSSLSYHTASDENYDISDHEQILFLDATSESELSDLGLFPAPVHAVSMTNPDFEKYLTYTEAYAHVVLNQPLLFPFINQFGGIPSPDFKLVEDYPPPIQET